MGIPAYFSYLIKSKYIRTSCRSYFASPKKMKMTMCEQNARVGSRVHSTVFKGTKIYLNFPPRVCLS